MDERGWSVDLGGGRRIDFPPIPRMPRIPGGALRVALVAAAVLVLA